MHGDMATFILKQLKLQNQSFTIYPSILIKSIMSAAGNEG